LAKKEVGAPPKHTPATVAAKETDCNNKELVNHLDLRGGPWAKGGKAILRNTRWGVPPFRLKKS